MSKNYSPLVYLEDVVKTFRDGNVETEVLAGIDLEIHAGEYVAIMGPSGCGKSTLLAIVGLMDAPSSGVYCFDGAPVQGMKPAERARIRNHDVGFVFQNFNLIGDLTVFENVEQPLSYQNMKSAERKHRVQEALERVGILDEAKRRPSQL